MSILKHDKNTWVLFNRSPTPQGIRILAFDGKFFAGKFNSSYTANEANTFLMIRMDVPEFLKSKIIFDWNQHRIFINHLHFRKHIHRKACN